MADPTNGQADPWTPVHHEDAEPEQAPAPKPAARPNRASSRPSGTAVPVGMSLYLPPEVMDQLADIAESQRDMADQFARLADTMEAFMKMMGAARPAETQEQQP